MTIPDDRLRAAYLGYGADAPSTAHPSADAIAAVVERSTPEAARLATLDHIGMCARCRRELDLLRATHDAARGPSTRAWPVRTMSLAAAAAIVIGISVSLSRGVLTHDTAAPVDRDASQAQSQQMIGLIAPLGDVAPATPRLVWHAVPHAKMYRVEVLSDSGAIVARADTPDTVVSAPTLAPGHLYRWWVRAMVDGETWRSQFGEMHTRRLGG
jgi:hypothetical protein